MSAVVVVDRRGQYYDCIGRAIAADALAFYVRAETGRAWQTAFIRNAFRTEREQLLADAPTYDPGEPEPDQFAIPYADLSHGA